MVTGTTRIAFEILKIKVCHDLNPFDPALEAIVDWSQSQTFVTLNCPVKANEGTACIQGRAFLVASGNQKQCQIRQVSPEHSAPVIASMYALQALHDRVSRPGPVAAMENPDKSTNLGEVKIVRHLSPYPSGVEYTNKSSRGYGNGQDTPLVYKIVENKQAKQTAYKFQMK